MCSKCRYITTSFVNSVHHGKLCYGLTNWYRKPYLETVRYFTNTEEWEDHPDERK